MQIGNLKGEYASTSYSISCITTNYQQTSCIAQWRCFIAQSRSCEKIYQSPEFFHYLTRTQSNKSDRFELLSVNDDNGRVIGVLPLRWSSINLKIRIGSFVIYTYRLSIIRLMGSLPMLEERHGLTNKIMKDLLHRYPDQGAILLQSCPSKEKEMLQKNHMVNYSVLYGWRTCHTIPIPYQFDEYLQKLSSKRRYNTAREIRRLTKTLGKLCLKRIEGVADVTHLFNCLAAIRSDAGNCGIDENDYTIFADNNICLSYTLCADGEWVAAVMGSRFEDTWHVHRIHFSQKYRQLSAGSVAMHLAIEDVIQNFQFTKIDFGFGTPVYKFASTHVLDKRATILATRKFSLASLGISFFVIYDEFHSFLAKSAITAYKAVRHKFVTR